jgi:hypothetical protein
MTTRLERFAPFSTCPYCDGVEFIYGPRGGSSVNIACDGCGARFNIAEVMLGEPPQRQRFFLEVLAPPPKPAHA